MASLKDAKEIVRRVKIDFGVGFLADALMTEGGYWRRGIFEVSPALDVDAIDMCGSHKYHPDLPWTIVVEERSTVAWMVRFPFTHADMARYAFRTKSQAKTAARKFAVSLRKALFIELGKEQNGSYWADWKDINTPTKRKRVANAMVKVLKG